MSRLRHIGPRALVRAVVLTGIMSVAADYLLGRRPDEVCGWLDGIPGISCPGITERADAAEAFVSLTGVIVAVAFIFVQRPLRRAWIESVANAQEISAVPTLWRLVTFLQWAVLMGAIAVLQGLGSVHYDLLQRDEIGTGSLLLTAALALGSAWLWTSWREHRTYSWATRVHGYPFYPAVLKGERKAYYDQLHHPWVREARDQDFPSYSEAEKYRDQTLYVVECDTCAYASDFHVTRLEAEQARDRHQRDTAP